MAAHLEHRRIWNREDGAEVRRQQAEHRLRAAAHALQVQVHGQRGPSARSPLAVLGLATKTEAASQYAGGGLAMWTWTGVRAANLMLAGVEGSSGKALTWSGATLLVRLRLRDSIACRTALLSSV